MTKTPTKTSTAKSSLKKSDNKRAVSSKKVDELKLGKFIEFEPLHLPEKEPRRGWQVFWGIMFLIFGLGISVWIGAAISDFKLAAISSWIASWGNILRDPVILTWIFVPVAVLIIPVICIIIGGLLLAGRRIKVFWWDILVVSIWIWVFNYFFVGAWQNIVQSCRFNDCSNTGGYLLLALAENLLSVIIAVGLLKFAHHYNKCHRKKL